MLSRLANMLKLKKSSKYYAKRLGVSEKEVVKMMGEIYYKRRFGDDAETAIYIKSLEDSVVKFEENVKDGSAEVVFNSQEQIKTLDELIEKCKIDVHKWDIIRYVQNYWGNVENPSWQVKAWLGKKKEHQLFQDSFLEFLSTYKPVSQKTIAPAFKGSKTPCCLLINKQDSHLNKADINGENDMGERMGEITYKIEVILQQAALSNNLEKVVYVIGSDEFNSEFTGATTKGTPQQNIGNYHDTFKLICDHEVLVISLLLKRAENVEVVYVSGNHDEYVGWHMINWLQTYFREENRVSFDCSPRYRKYVSYGTSAFMLNHGDAIKPAKLASIFPMEYRDGWSNHENFYIFTGDKHHEVSQDFNGIKFYQIAAFSNAKSKWDDKHGYVLGRGEVTAFLIDSMDGMTNIFKQYL